MRQPFAVTDSISLMTNDSEQSPVVLVFSFSLDPVPCLFPSPLTPLQTSSQLLGRSPAGLGSSPRWVSQFRPNAPLSLWVLLAGDWSSPATSTALQSRLLYPTGCRLLALSRLVVTPSTQVLMRALDTGMGALSSPSGQG